MSSNSNISWTDATWPIVAGCEYASPGCSNCWAVRDSWRLAHNPHPAVRAAFDGTVRKTETGTLVWTGLVRTLPQRLDWPLTWRKARKIFVCSQSDLFHPKVPFEFIAAAFGVMAAAPQHTFQVLTKHPGRALEFFAWLQADREGPAIRCLWEAREALGADFSRHAPHEPPEWPLENVWFGVTTEDQKRADERIPKLLAIPAAVRWVSYEPALELVSFEGWLPTRCCNGQDCACRGLPVYPAPYIDLIVFGGESAQTRAKTRQCDIEWGRITLNACKITGTKFFMKQGGTNLITSGSGPVWTAKLDDTGKGYFRVLPPAGKTSRYKFHEMEHLPEDLRVQEFPA